MKLGVYLGCWFSLMALAMPLSAQFSEPGSFVAKKACAAFTSIKRKKNDEGVHTEAGKTYIKRGWNKKGGDWVWLKFPQAKTKMRWVHISCGQPDSSSDSGVVIANGNEDVSLPAVDLKNQSLFPGLKGEALIARLRSSFRSNGIRGYRHARTEMFSSIDNVQGKVRLVYTGQLFATRGIPEHNIVNTEHTWPQSKFKRNSRRGKLKSDLHHLYPTLNPVNRDRSSHPFCESNDQATKKWYRSAKAIRNQPSPSEIDEYSELGNSCFEPREDHKGNVARAMFYVWTMYGDSRLALGWFKGQVATLRKWHQLDPVDQVERQRSAAIAMVQGAENPFVIDPTLVERVLMKE